MSRITPNQLLAMKEAGTKITMVTAYDFPSAQLADRAEIDILLVGDSLGTVIQGGETTLTVRLDAICYHAEMVARAVVRGLVVADLPFPYAQLGPDDALRAAVRLIQEASVWGVKVEGGKNRADVVQKLVAGGVPVMGHCGLLPQDVRRLGGYKVARNRDALLEDADAIEAAGAFALVLECVPRDIAAEIAAKLAIPVIGIGAGNGCDGQVLVWHDLLGYKLPEKSLPKHSRPYADLGTLILDGLIRYAEEVRRGVFPGDDESFGA